MNDDLTILPGISDAELLVQAARLGLVRPMISEIARRAQVGESVVYSVFRGNRTGPGAEKVLAALGVVIPDPQRSDDAHDDLNRVADEFDRDAREREEKSKEAFVKRASVRETERVFSPPAPAPNPTDAFVDMLTELAKQGATR